jgi:hypothetical protein
MRAIQTRRLVVMRFLDLARRAGTDEMYLAKELEVLVTLENAAEAHRDLESRRSTGKLVLSVGS